MLLPLLLSSALALSPEDASAILQIEALRLPPAALELYVQSPDPATRARAARALGRLRDRASLTSLTALSADPDVHVRVETAFALGQTPETLAALSPWLTSEAAPEVRAAIAEAMGKQGNATTIPALVTSLRARGSRPLDPPLEARAAAAALGRLAIHGVEGTGGAEVTGALLDLLGRFDAELRQNAAFALARIGAASLPEEQRARLITAARGDRDPVVRAFLVRATGPLGMDAAERLALYQATSKDVDSGVRVATARAAAASGCPVVVGMLQDPDVGVRMEAITALAKVEGPDHLALLGPILDAGDTLEAAEAARNAGDPRELLATTALTNLAARDLLPATGDRSLVSLLDQARPTSVRAAAASVGKDRDALLKLAINDGEAAVRTAAVGRLLELEPRGDQVLALFQAFDPMVVAAAAEYLGQHPTAEAERALLAALRDAKPTDLDLLVAGLKALIPLYDGVRPLLHKPSGEAATIIYELQSHPEPLVSEQAARVAHLLGIKPPPYQHRVASVDLDAVLRLRTARLQTTRGEMILSLDPDNAPITVMNWAGLAERGWFDGLTFHRVVPDFVVQDGDPRGDGMGGPGYAIPDEIAPGHYDEGTIGMALSGPDTGGSQWFVTLSPQPHLDGGYTIFGHVTQGMQVARALQPGDRILHVIIEHN